MSSDTAGHPARPDRWRLSAVAHASLARANPLDADDLERALDAIAEDTRGLDGGLNDVAALDVGCGTGDLVERLADRGAVVTGYDASAYAVAAATVRLAGRPGVTVLETDVAPRGSYGLVTCVGSSGALADTVPGGLVAAAGLVARPGHVLLADGFWARPPAAALLEALGADPDEMRDLAGTRAALEAAGVEVLFERVASSEQWSRYESAWQDGLRSHVAAHPDDPEAARFTAAADAAHDRVARWPDTIGFALFAGRLVRSAPVLR